MTDSKALNVALIIHVLFRYTIFVEYPECHSSWTRVSSFIILASCILFLLDIEIFPIRYKKHVSNLSFVSFLIESCLALLIIEISMLLIWLKIEYVIVLFIRATLGNTKSFWSSKIINLTVITISIVFFFYAAFVTNRMDNILIFTRFYYSKLKNFIQYLFTRSPETDNNESRFNRGQCVIVPCEQLGINPNMCGPRIDTAAIGPGGDEPTRSQTRRRRRSNSRGGRGRSNSCRRS